MRRVGVFIFVLVAVFAVTTGAMAQEEPAELYIEEVTSVETGGDLGWAFYQGLVAGLCISAIILLGWRIWGAVSLWRKRRHMEYMARREDRYMHPPEDAPDFLKPLGAPPGGWEPPVFLDEEV